MMGVKKAKRFQCSRITLLVIMIIASILIGANVFPHYPAYLDDTPEGGGVRVRDGLYLKHNLSEMGWPFRYYIEGYPVEPSIYPGYAALDCIIALGVLFTTWMVLETWTFSIRRKCVGSCSLEGKDDLPPEERGHS